jgi:hypothetical protein
LAVQVKEQILVEQF